MLRIQNDPTTDKEYRITYLDSKGETCYARRIAKTPKLAMAMVESEIPGSMALTGRRPTKYRKTSRWAL